MDTRGQGGQYGSGGDTPDPVGSGPAAPGFVTRGILDPATYYYRRVLTDAVRAVDAARALPGVDPHGRRRREQPGRRDRARRRRPGARPRRGDGQRAVPLRHPARPGDHRRRPVRRDRPVPRGPPRRRRPGAPHPVVRRRRRTSPAARPPRPCSRPACATRSARRRRCSPRTTRTRRSGRSPSTRTTTTRAARPTTRPASWRGSQRACAPPDPCATPTPTPPRRRARHLTANSSAAPSSVVAAAEFGAN